MLIFWKRKKGKKGGDTKVSVPSLEKRTLMLQNPIVDDTGVIIGIIIRYKIPGKEGSYKLSWKINEKDEEEFVITLRRLAEGQVPLGMCTIKKTGQGKPYVLNDGTSQGIRNYAEKFLLQEENADIREMLMPLIGLSYLMEICS